MARPKPCFVCGEPIPHSRLGRPQKYCSRYCRYQAHGIRRKAVRRKANAERIKRMNEGTGLIRSVALHLAHNPPHDVDDVLSLMRMVYDAGFRDASEAASLTAKLEALMDADPGVVELLTTGISV